MKEWLNILCKVIQLESVKYNNSNVGVLTQSLWYFLLLKVTSYQSTRNYVLYGAYLSWNILSSSWVVTFFLMIKNKIALWNNN